MAKIWGFLVSALLVGLCLCLDIRYFPNVTGGEKSSSQATRSVGDESIVEPAEAPASDEAAPDVEQGAEPETPEAESGDSTYARANGARSLTNAPDRYTWEQASHRVENAASSGSVVVKSSGKPQGGKFVSIPSIQMDAITSDDEVGARVVAAPTAVDTPGYWDK
ncbi:MAG: hypothetical protein IJU03_07065 [Thermoguttaceae bacterium]|nr:hypothetical protein [Thermoguttaceae bacterium]